MTVGVYGLGRFGLFWADFLSSYFPVFGYNRTPRKELPPSVNAASEEEVLNCDAVFFCVSISSFAEVLQHAAPLMKPGSLIMDTCSVKTFPVTWMEKYLPGGVNILATHPMFGPDSASGGVAGFPIVVCPVRVSDSDLSFWVRNFEEFGLQVLQMSADEHDHQVAYTQGITHFIGRVLEDLNLTLHPLSTLGFRKILEVMEQTCNDPWQLFIDLQKLNPYTGEMREELRDSFSKIITKLENGPAQ